MAPTATYDNPLRNVLSFLSFTAADIYGTTGVQAIMPAIAVTINTGVRNPINTVNDEESDVNENILPIYENAYPVLSALNITNPIITTSIV